MDQVLYYGNLNNDIVCYTKEYNITIDAGSQWASYECTVDIPSGYEIITATSYLQMPFVQTCIGTLGNTISVYICRFYGTDTTQTWYFYIKYICKKI